MHEQTFESRLFFSLIKESEYKVWSDSCSTNFVIAAGDTPSETHYAYGGYIQKKTRGFFFTFQRLLNTEYFLSHVFPYAISKVRKWHLSPHMLKSNWNTGYGEWEEGAVSIVTRLSLPSDCQRGKVGLPDYIQYVELWQMESYYSKTMENFTYSNSLKPCWQFLLLELGLECTTPQINVDYEGIQMWWWSCWHSIVLDTHVLLDVVVVSWCHHLLL